MSQRQLTLTPAQLNELRAILSQFSEQAEVHCALLADFSGQDIVNWEGRGAIDTSTIAALSAGDMLATMEIGRMLGGRRACNLIVQEHDDLTILISRVGEGLLLLLATAKDVPLGWARLAIKRASERILSIVGAATLAPPPAAVNDEFVRDFASQLDTLW
jgi:predicted regulator of Ras-like GTPase activity (Roadblock/LC7/MglB family)